MKGEGGKKKRKTIVLTFSPKIKSKIREEQFRLRRKQNVMITNKNYAIK